MSREPKILRRIVNLNNTNTQFSNLNSASPTGSTFAQRLAADPTRAVGFDGKKLGFDPKVEVDTTSIAGKVQDALLPAVGYVDKSVLISLLSRLKVPIIATLGIAAVSGLAYLAYKLYKSRQEAPKHVQEEVKQQSAESIMEDLMNVAPNVLSSNSWYEMTRKKVEDIIRSKQGDQLVEALAKLTAELKEKQQFIAPVKTGGSLLDIIAMKEATSGMGGMVISGIRRPILGAGVRSAMC